MATTEENLWTLQAEMAESRRIQRDQLFERVFQSVDPETERHPFYRKIDSFVDTFQTNAADGGLRPVSAGAAGLIERQVAQAIERVLGRSSSGSSDLLATLETIYPADGEGRVATEPMRGQVDLYGASANGSTAGLRSAAAAGLAGQLPARQAVLYRQASVIVDDFRRVLGGLEGLTTEVDPSQLAALRASIVSALDNLLYDFGRWESRPTAQRVETYLLSLDRHMGHLKMVLDADDASETFTSAEEETRKASLDLLNSYRATLSRLWNDYLGEQETATGLVEEWSLSEQVAEVSRMLRVVGGTADDLARALDAVGYSTEERHSASADLDQLGFNPGAWLTDLTVADLIDWVERYARLQGPADLADGGQYGLNLVADQAESLCLVLLALQENLANPPRSGLGQALSDSRVASELEELAWELKTIADLGVQRAGETGRS
jgi:hypothetical protein